MPSDSALGLIYRPGTEARRHRRVPVQLVVRYRPTFVSQWVKGKSVNMSISGLCIASEVLPVVGTEMAIEIFRRDKLFLRATGVVRWMRAEMTIDGQPRGFGIELVEASETTQTRLGELIDAHSNGRLDQEEAEAEEMSARETVNWRWAAVAGIAILLLLIAWLAL
jgi:hypothetical protein